MSAPHTSAEMLFAGVRLHSLWRKGDRLLGELSLEKSCPLLDGHFPHHPVLPAVGQIKIVVEILRRSLEQALEIASIPRMKLTLPVRPGDHLDLEVTLATAKNEARWSIRRGCSSVSSGSLRLRPPGHPASPR